MQCSSTLELKWCVCFGNGRVQFQDSDAIKLFVGQIPKHMEEEDLRPVFEEFGEIFDLAVIRDKISGLHRGEGMRPSECPREAAWYGAREAILQVVCSSK